MSREPRVNDLCRAYPVAARKAGLGALASAAVLLAILVGSSAQGQDSGWKPSWQQPPVSSASRTVEQAAYTAKATAASNAEPRRPVRGQATVEFPTPPAEPRRANAVRPASAQLEAPREPAVKPVPQPEPVPQGQIVYDGQNGPVYGDPAGIPGDADFGYPGPGYAACGPGGPCDDGCSFRLPFNPCWFGPLRGIVYTHADYGMWWTKGNFTPALVTTGPLDQAGTAILFGDSDLNAGFRSGFGVTLGVWMDPCQTSAIEARYLGIGRDTAEFFASDATHAVLDRPFFNLQTGVQDVEETVAPGVTDGNIAVASASDFQAVDILLRHALARQCGFRIDGLVGYRYERLNEGLSIHEFQTVIDLPPLAVGTTIATDDVFQTRNEFHGGVIGVNTQWQWCRWSFDMLAKMALGTTRSEVTIAGSTTTTPPGGATPTVASGGFLALPAQVGQYRQSQFAVAPELGLTLGYNMTCRLRATLGYSVLYLSKVARPGDQVNLNLHPDWFPPAQLNAPSFKIVTNDFWAQGLNLGLDYRF